MNKRTNSNKIIGNKSIGEYLIKDINDFQRVSRILFEFLSCLTSGSTLTPQQISQLQNLDNTIPISSTVTPTMVLQLMNNLIEVDKNYQISLKKLEKHQNIQKEIMDIQNEIEEKDKLISTLATNLKDIESFLENELSQEGVNINSGIGRNSNDNSLVNEVLINLDEPDESSTYNNNNNNGINEVTPEELISYAHKIAGTTYAPYGYQPYIPLANTFKPPQPQDEMMRVSVLFTKIPSQLLKYYGLADIDAGTPITNTTSPPLQPGQESSPTDQQAAGTTQDTSQLSPTVDQLQPIQSIIQPQQPILSIPQQLNIDLDLNPDLDSDEEDDDEEEEEESENEEIAWE